MQTVAIINIGFFAGMSALYIYVGEWLKVWLVKQTGWTPELTRNLLNISWTIFVFAIIFLHTMPD